jgi:hypothetical protein
VVTSWTDFVEVAEISYHVLAEVQVEVEVKDRSLFVRLVGFDSSVSPVVKSQWTDEAVGSILKVVHFRVDVDIGPIANYLSGVAAERYLSQKAAKMVNESYAVHLVLPVREFDSIAYWDAVVEGIDADVGSGAGAGAGAAGHWWESLVEMALPAALLFEPHSRLLQPCGERC